MASHARKVPIGQKLRARRLHLGLSQAEAGDRLGPVLQGRVSQWERGVDIPSRGQAAKIARFLGDMTAMEVRSHLEQERDERGPQGALRANEEVKALRREVAELRRLIVGALRLDEGAKR